MSEVAKLVILYVFAYLVGSVPTANIIARLVRRIDLRDYGSGNVGGSNLYAHVGGRWLFPMGFIDLFIKGSSPIWIGHYVSFFGWELTSIELIGAGLLAVTGHNWSMYLRFTGGRGIAVAIGAMYAIAKWEMALFAGIAFLIWLKFRASGVAVYLSLLLLPFWTLIPVSGLRQPLVVTWFMVGIIGLVTAKRLLSNWTPFPEGIPKRRVLFNRLLRDRDTIPRDEWVYRTPDESVIRE